METRHILGKVCGSIDILIEAGSKHGGLFPSILDIATHEMPEALPPKIPGQRNEDRAHPGSNLMHDHPLLETMYGLSRALDRPDYAQAADRYLERFATHCTDTVTGLFPWGEHAFWNLAEDAVGNAFPLAYDWWTAPAIHDHLRAAPFWLWEKLYEYNPGCVERFAEGLDYHWREGEPEEYCRHANIEVKERPPREHRSCDFPRHGGFYIMDWSFAYAKTGRDDFLAQIHRMLDYWWNRRLDEHGMLPLESKTPENVKDIYGLTSPGQAMSLGRSLLETAEFLQQSHPDLASVMRERGTVYVGCFLSLPHDLENGVYVSCTRQDTGEIVSTMSSWGSVYGSGTTSGVGVACTGYYQMTGNEGFLKWAESAGRRYLTDPLPKDKAIPSADLGMAIAFMANLYDVTGKTEWLDAGLKLAEALMEVYLHGDLPRGAAGLSFYDSQMGPAYLLHALARIALLAESASECPVEADYSGR